MKKDNVKKGNGILQATWARVAASTTLCTTLIILAPYFSGAGPKLPKSSGE